MSRIDELMALIRAEIICHIASHGQHDWAPKIERALRDALEPQGWQLVPKEPTNEMRDQGRDSHWFAEQHELDDGPLMSRANRAVYVYKAMLAAAPKEPTK